MIDRVRMTFESHWASEHFEPYDPAVNGDELERALREHDRRSLGETSTISFANLDVRPYPHQQRMLDALTIERERHDRHRNLVVAATGTGKTVVAALDYRQLARALGATSSLLFVAHRERDPAPVAGDLPGRAARRLVRRDSRRRPRRGRARTSSRWSSRCTRIGWRRSRRTTFDVVVVDEFHHAGRDDYDRLLQHLEPRRAARAHRDPERLDGQDVTEWFDGRIAVELRLWEAIDQGFLVPFQYFGVADGTDLRSLRVAARRLRARRAQQRALQRRRCASRKLLEAIQRIVLDPGAMRALGFCVSKEHARLHGAQVHRRRASRASR